MHKSVNTEKKKISPLVNSTTYLWGQLYEFFFFFYILVAAMLGSCAEVII